MALRIINNRRIDLTHDEYALYQEICKSYTTTKLDGASLFKDLFETNDKGIITFLKPPKSAYTSLECYFFIVNIFLHQHLRQNCDDANSVIKEAKEVIAEAKELISKLKK